MATPDYRGINSRPAGAGCSASQEDVNKADLQSRTVEEQTLIRRFKELTEQLLPARARAEHWPIRFDHCFKRICLDHAFGDVWYKHLAKPAERHIAGTALREAVQCAEDLEQGSLFLLRERDAASLRVRGKHPKG